MQISSNVGTVVKSADKASVIKPLYVEKLSKDELKDIKEEIKERSNAIAFNSSSIQNGVVNSRDKFTQEYDAFQSFLSDIGYKGKPIAELSQEEANELVSENGFFGIIQTSERIANFVVSGASGDEDRLRAGREGMIQGFKEAQELWGEELPEISQETMKRSLEIVDKAIYDLGFSILDEEV